MEYFYTETDCRTLEKGEIINSGALSSIDSGLILITNNGEVITPCLNIDRVKSLEYEGNKVYYLSRTNNDRKSYLIDGILIDISDLIRISSKDEVFSIPFDTPLEFETSEKYGEFTLIYFTGKRHFVVIARSQKVLYASYYDRQNFNNQKMFVRSIFDMLNHGKVFGIKNNKFEENLVYLDNYELKLKEEFVPFVFLDCVMAGNLNYALSLMRNESPLDANNIKEFFPEFDKFISITNREHVLLNKNTPKGICRFELNDNKITNIILL